ncbi:Homoserine kinase [compost metagenome]
MAAALEGHPDNVGASLFGGIVVSALNGDRADYVRITPHERLEALVAIPAFQLSTEKARHALPSQISMKDAVFNVSHSSLLVAALASGELGLIRHAMKDRLHQPYRAALIPGMAAILEQAADYGALGAALSGAGPTLIAFVESDSPDKPRLEKFLLETLKQEGIHADTLWLSPCLSGPEIMIEDAGKQPESTLMDRIKGEVKA